VFFVGLIGRFGSDPVRPVLTPEDRTRGLLLMTFGKLQQVDIRTCWADEAREFTPWLASQEGIRLLSESLGMELALEGKEIAVGPYSADILARDLTTDAYVVIENQLEKTNHDHFGKALTYAAVLGAATVVWVARIFTEEHRKAVEWLNELTKGSLMFYGVELQVWKIGESEPAPRFEVVCGPNEVVRQAQAARDSEEHSETKQLQLRFWKDVRASLEATGKFRSLQSPRPQTWFEVALGRSGIHLSLSANTFDKRVDVQVYLNHRVADQALSQLLKVKSEIESEIGSPLEWNPNPNKKDKVIVLRRNGNIADQEQWPGLVAWVTEHTVKFHLAFAPRVAKLDLTAAAGPQEEDVQ